MRTLLCSADWLIALEVFQRIIVLYFIEMLLYVGYFRPSGTVDRVERWNELNSLGNWRSWKYYPLTLDYPTLVFLFAENSESLIQKYCYLCIISIISFQFTTHPEICDLATIFTVHQYVSCCQILGETKKIGIMILIMLLYVLIWVVAIIQWKTTKTST